MRRAGALLLVVALLAGCWSGPSSSGASGTVVDRERSEASARSWREYNYSITVREDSGRQDTGRVSRGTYEACEIGKRWPDCKR